MRTVRPGPAKLHDAQTRSHNARTLSLAAVVAVLGLGGCGESAENVNGTKGQSIEVTQTSWHNGKWPFKVSHGILGCHTPPYPGAVTFNVDGRTYWINGDAGDVAEQEHYEDIHPIWLKEHSAYGGEELRVDIGGMIERGLKLCEEAEGK